MTGAVLKIAAGEFRLQTRRFAFWLFAAVFVTFGIFYFTRFTNIAPGEDSMTQSVKLARNSPYSLSLLMALIVLIFSHFTAALSIDPVLRDRRIGLLPLILSSPMRESQYVFGKFLGVAAVSLLAPLFMIVTAAVAQFVPNTSVGLIPPNVLAFVVAYFEFAVPLTLLICSLTFAAATRTSNTKLVYALVTVLMMSYMLIINAISSVDRRWMTYLDPCGGLWLAEVVAKGKTNAELNALGWMMDRGFLINRLVVLAGAIIPLVYVARGFSRWEALAGSGKAMSARAARAAAKRAEKESKRAARDAAGAAGGAGALAPSGADGGLRPLAASVRLATGALRQFGRVTATELRLLSHERALFFLAPLLVFILLTSYGTTSGPFEAELIPVSSQVVRETFGVLLIFLFGTTIFFAGESAFRERECGLEDMLHACPVPETALVFGKAAANLVASFAFVLIAAATGAIYQLAKGAGPIDLRPFFAYYGVLLFPTLLLMTALALFVSALARNKQAAYGSLLAVGGALVWAFVRGHRHWLYNLPAVGLSSYSDIVGFGPLGYGLFAQRAYIIAIGVFLLCAAAGIYPRTAAVRVGLSPAAWRRRGVLVPAAAALAIALALGLRINAWVENGIGSIAFERLAVRYEKEVKPWLSGLPEPEIAGVDLDLDLYPERNAFRVAGEYRLRNAHPIPLDAIHLTISPRLVARGEVTLAGRRPDAFENAVATFQLAEPLAPGAEIPLAFRWEGRVPDGLPRHSAGLNTWIQPGATFLHSFDAAALSWLPGIGYHSEIEIGDDKTRRKYKLGKRESLPDDDGQGVTPGFMYQWSAFPYHAKIRAPEGERVLSAGRLVAERSIPADDAGGPRREFEFATDGKIYFFPVMAGRWVERRDGGTAVYHDARHGQNAGKILAALSASRAFFSNAFAPFPYEDLRLAEFPRHGTFAMGYPTLIPYSESIGFLTKDPKDLPNLNFYVTAHEVAHQWWGTVVWPAHAKGSPVLTEGLANYSSLLVAEHVEGDPKRKKMFEQYEDRYLRRRDANEERPLMLLDGDRRGDAAVWYDRGGVVFYMLDRILGRERMLAGMKEYVRRYSFQDDHPTMTDFVALFEELYPETTPFFEQYVEGKAIPNPGFTKAERESLPDGRWRVSFEIANRGEGDLDVVIEAHEGKRADEEKRERKAREAARRAGASDGGVGDAAKGGAVAGGTTDAVALTAGAVGDSTLAGIGATARLVVPLDGIAPAKGEIVCDFKPGELEMDPDGTVLMQERKKGRRAL